MSNELVSGSSGFIGRHLSLALDEPATLDIKEMQDIQHIRRMWGVKTIFHLAAARSVPRSIDNPMLCTAHNVMGTVNLLDVAQRSNVSNFVFSSSSSIYGGMQPNEKTLVENRTPNPLSPYAASKMACEYYIQSYNHLYPDFKGTILRYFNVYGPGQPGHDSYCAVIPRFIEAARKNEPLRIFGDGEQSRCWTYVDDVVSANIKSVGHKGTYNIANSKYVSVNKLADLIIELVDSKSDIVHEPRRAGDVQTSIPDLSKTKKELKWEAKVDLKEGLIKTI